MKKPFPVAMFWSGRHFSIVELASILSVQRAGHDITIFGYDRPVGLPEYVNYENANEVLEEGKFLYHMGVNPSLGTNLFRYRLMDKSPCLWLDTDILMLEPIEDGGQCVYGWQDDSFINGAVLHLKKESAVLRDLLKFTSDEYSIPPFFDEEIRNELLRSKLNNTPIHVSNMFWGVWGPRALTHFISLNEVSCVAKRREVFYPLHHSECHALFSRAHDISHLIKDDTKCIHMWNHMITKPSSIRPTIKDGDLLAEEGSFFYEFCKRELGFIFSHQ